MAPADIEMPWRGWVRARSIGEASEASSTQTRKSRATELLAAEVLRRQGWSIYFHDIRIGGVQVDLLGRDPNGILSVLEVKAESPLTHLSGKQFARLRRVVGILAGYESTQMRLVVVAGRDLRIVPVDGLTV